MLAARKAALRRRLSGAHDEPPARAQDASAPPSPLSTPPQSPPPKRPRSEPSGPARTPELASPAHGTYLMSRLLGSEHISPTIVYPSALWWTRAIHDATADRYDDLIPRLLRSMRISEACAGLGSALGCATALSIPLASGTASDKKEHSRKWLVDHNIAAEHIFDSMQHHGDDLAFCHRHGRLCRTAAADGPDDLLVCGTPCQPFTSQRADRFQKGCATHARIDTTFGDEDDTLIGILRRRRPLGLLLENVTNICKPDPRSKQVPIHTFLAQLMTIKRTDAPDSPPLYPHAHIFEMDASSWMTISRPRRAAKSKQVVAASSLSFRRLLAVHAH